MAFLIIMILVCSVIVKATSGSKTLDEYAQENPAIAYATPEKTMAPSPSPAKINAPTKEPSPEMSPSSEMAPSPEITASSETEISLETEVSLETAPSPEIHASELTTTADEDITYYQEGFSYQPLTNEIKAKITGISYPVSESVAPALSVEAINIMSDEQTPAVSYDDLCYMNVLYYDFNGEVQTGELICNQKLAQDFVEIFYELYLNEYRIEKIRLIDEYNGDDTASMEDNNTSCFNYRVVDGTSSLSKHALGCAIDINPFYNPYIVFDKTGGGDDYISPKGSEIYVDRSQNFPYKIDENDLCYKLFKEHGFTWGGDWNSCKDYQHFQKTVD